MSKVFKYCIAFQGIVLLINRDLNQALNLKLKVFEALDSIFS